MVRWFKTSRLLCLAFVFVVSQGAAQTFPFAFWKTSGSAPPPLAIGDSSSNAMTSDATSQTWSINCPGSLRGVGLLFTYPDQADATQITSLTVGGTSCTRVGGARSELATWISVEIWKLSAPASGSQTISVTYANSLHATGHAVSFTGANQTTGNLTGTFASAEGTGTAVSVNASSASGEIVVSINTAGASTTFVANASQTRIAHITETVGSTTGMSTFKAGSTTTTMSATSSDGSDSWIIGAVAFKP